MRGQGKNETNLHERWMEEGDLLPGMGTGGNRREVGRPAWWRGLHRCRSCPLHCLPGPPHTTLHNTAQAPAELYLLPRSRNRETKFHQLSTFAERGLFCLCTTLSTGVVVLPAPPLPGSSCSQLLSCPWRGRRRPCHLDKLYSNCSECQCPDPISQRKPWSPRRSGQDCER